MVATLPLLATFLDKPYDPSPYAPVSRLFWNEFYVHVEGIPELKHSPAAQSALDSAEMNADRSALQAASLVDYRRQMAMKRSILEQLSRSIAQAPSERRETFERFVRSRPAVEDYARFRAAPARFRVQYLYRPGRYSGDGHWSEFGARLGPRTDRLWSDAYAGSRLRPARPPESK